MTKYRHAIVKFNGGRGALLCNQCSIILAYGVRHKDVKHYCKDCERVKNGKKNSMV
jgi:hypothetical protein